ncbi:alkaline phosphatase [uncultured Paracoccus sp.]|uniref:alkaline phosphatase n=1 Tax=uncultured Paracoccus sp. TaxID=189685 RepID=UPI0025EF6A7F|nr:alkaline phosphatase [uncultured Paracoccus sp.]
MITRSHLLAAASAVALSVPAAGHAAQVKNTILMISDGASWGTWDMANYWAYGTRSNATYDKLGVKLGMTTTPLNTSNTPQYSGEPQVSYDPSKAWTTEASADVSQGHASVFTGYEYLKKDYTDSAAAATALASGEKTYNNAINYDDFAQPLSYITQGMKTLGKSTGVVSSVPVSHATPAGFSSDNISRNNYGEISRDQINGTLDLVIGGGNPFYDDNGQTRATGNFAPETGTGSGWIAESVYDTVTTDTENWKYLETKADFEALANGTLALEDGQKIYGLPTVGSTLQFNRTLAGQGADAANPSGIALNDDVPTLATLTTGALNYLGQNQDGFFAMVEGGAVDWAAHANNTGKIIEEQIDFNNAVTAAFNWVETYSNWDETLFIVLTDHGNGLPLGPDSDTNPFQLVTNNGQGVLPGVKWYSGTHTNENTKFWAHGAGSDMFYDSVVGYDQQFAAIIGHNTDGAYIENTAVYDVIAAANGIQPAPVPLPAGVVLMGTGVAAFAALRRRRKAA